MHIEHYLEGDRTPFLEWMASLTAPELTRATDHLLRLSIGNTTGLKSLSGGLLEQRIRGKQELRVYFGRIKHNHLLSLWGGSKKNQSKDILKARTYWSRYQNTHDHGLV